VKQTALGQMIYTAYSTLTGRISVAATHAAGALLWRESYLPFGEGRLDPTANRDKPGCQSARKIDPHRRPKLTPPALW
jgi:hypothetical protein